LEGVARHPALELEMREEIEDQLLETTGDRGNRHPPLVLARSPASLKRKRCCRSAPAALGEHREGMQLAADVPRGPAPHVRQALEQTSQRPHRQLVVDVEVDARAS